jgi:hypothetical protein
MQQGCQIFLDARYQKGERYTKNTPNIPKSHKNIQNSLIIDLMAINHTNIFHCKTLQDLPTLDFWLENIPSGNPGMQ